MRRKLFEQGRSCAWMALVLVASLFQPTAHGAEKWPDRPIRLIVAQPPGGATDTVARVLAKRMAEFVQQQVIVENKAGASGTIGAGYVAGTVPDGYTLLFGASTEVVVSPAAGQKTNYDPKTAFRTIGIVGDTPLAIVANSSVKEQNLADLVHALQTSMQPMNYGSPGYGSSMHFAAEALQMIAHVKLTHVPYKGAAPVLMDVIGGQVPLGVVGLPPAIPFEQSGKLRIVAVTSAKRSALLPNVPTVEEAVGAKDFRFSNWWGVFAPAKLPDSVARPLAYALRDSLADATVQKQMLESGVEPLGLYGKAASDFLDSERQRYTSLAKEAGLSMP